MKQPYESTKFGTIYEEIKDTLDGWLVMEIAYTDKDGHLIGYWAHGYFDPELPYQGE